MNRQEGRARNGGAVLPARPVEAVVFDWGGTLTPWHEVDLTAAWYAYAQVYDPRRAASLAGELFTAEIERWQSQHRSAGQNGAGRLDQVLLDCGVDLNSGLHHAAMGAYLEFWEPHTRADPEAVPLLQALRQRGIKVGLLSNTLWPRRHHEAVFGRDGLLGAARRRRLLLRASHRQAAPGRFHRRARRGGGHRSVHGRVRR